MSSDLQAPLGLESHSPLRAESLALFVESLRVGVVRGDFKEPYGTPKNPSAFNYQPFLYLPPLGIPLGKALFFF